MKLSRSILVGLAVLVGFIALISSARAQFNSSLSLQGVNSAQPAAPDSIVQLTADSLGLPLISPEALPRSGTFFLMSPSPGGFTALPYPCPPAGYLPTYSIIPGGILG